MTHRQKWVVLNAVDYGVGSKSWSHKFKRRRFTDWNFCNLYWSHLIDLSSWSQGLCYAFKSSNFSFQTPCLAEPSKNGGICKPNYGDGNYECQCLIGSKGKNCHEGNIKYKMHSPVTVWQTLRYVIYWTVHLESCLCTTQSFGLKWSAVIKFSQILQMPLATPD